MGGRGGASKGSTKIKMLSVNTGIGGWIQYREYGGKTYRVDRTGGFGTASASPIAAKSLFSNQKDC